MLHHFHSLPNPILTQREQKGFSFEVDVQKMLKSLHIQFRGNPCKPKSWKRHNRPGADILVCNTVELECKSIDGKVFPSWVKRDWLPRFSPTSLWRIVCYRGNLKLSKESFDLIRNMGIILVHFSQLAHVIMGVTKLLNSYSNLLSPYDSPCSSVRNPCRLSSVRDLFCGKSCSKKQNPLFVRVKSSFRHRKWLDRLKLKLRRIEEMRKNE